MSFFISDNLDYNMCNVAEVIVLTGHCVESAVLCLSVSYGNECKNMQ